MSNKVSTEDLKTNRTERKGVNLLVPFETYLIIVQNN